MKEKTDKLDFINIKKLLLCKDNVKRMRRQATHWEKILAKGTSDKRLLFKIYKELFKLNNKKTNNSKNSPKTLTDNSPKNITDGK